MHRAHVHTRAGETGSKPVGKQIHPDAADHPHSNGSRTQFACSHCLVCAFAARQNLKIAPRDSLAGRGKTAHPHYEIHVEAAHNHYCRFQIPVVYPGSPHDQHD